MHKKIINNKDGIMFQFEYVNNRQIIFGENKVEALAELLTWHKKSKILFVTSSFLKDISTRVTSIFDKLGVSYVVYDKVDSEPDLHLIDNAVKIFNDEKCDCTVALGGGSVIDVAKAIGMLAQNGGEVEEYQMNGRQPTILPSMFIAIPTTSGTGAEATKVSVVLNNNNGLKKSLYHTTMIADFAILDPTLVTGLPAKITASTGMDAISHAIESYVSTNANTFSEMYSLKAISLINENLEKAVKDGNDLEVRGNMLLGSYLAGCAIACAGIGIAHIMAQPLGAMFHIPHGDACSIFLPISMELNMESATKKYVEVAKALNVYDASKSDKENVALAVARVREIIKNIGAPNSLKPYIKDMPTDAELVDVVQRTTGHVGCNPRKLDEALMLETFKAALI